MIKKLLVIFGLIFFVPFIVNAEEVELEFEKIFGADYRDHFKDVIQTQYR